MKQCLFPRTLVRTSLACMFLWLANGPALAQAAPLLQQLKTPNKLTEQTLAAAPVRWEQSWAAAWARATTYYRIQAASTVVNDPMCQGDLGFHPRIAELTRAIADRRYGEATRLISVVQDKSMCLGLEGARGLEFALAGFVHRAVTELSGADSQIAVHGALNVGTLVFDQLQYTRRSYWLPMMKFHADKLAPIIARYPKAEFGFLVFDWSRNSLSTGVDPMLMAASMRDFNNYADGTCSMLEMAGAGFRCKGWVGQNGLGGAGAGGSGGAGGGLPSIPSGNASVACVASAARSTGVRGQLACAAKAVAGVTFDPRSTTAQDLLQQGLAGGSPGIHDPGCTLSQDAGNVGGNTDLTAAKKEPTTWDKIKDAASKAGGVVIDVVVSIFDMTPPLISDLKPLASAEGSDAARGGLQAAQAISAQNALMTDDAAESYQKKRDGRVMTDPQANQRTVNNTNDPLGGRGGGGCSNGSNAARRAHALFDCITSGGTMPTNRGPNNPLIARPDPDQVQTPATGAMACMMNGGDLPRSGVDDPKCAMARCAPGAAACPCDKLGGAGGLGLGGTPTQPITATTSPHCAEPPCGSLLPKSPGVVIGGGPNGGGSPTVGGTPPIGTPPPLPRP